MAAEALPVSGVCGTGRDPVGLQVEVVVGQHRRSTTLADAVRVSDTQQQLGDVDISRRGHLEIWP
jgi:hypothetical protein